jgi:hypothetical protein
MAGDRKRRQSLGRAAQRRALARYGAERLVRDVEALYGELVAPRE